MQTPLHTTYREEAAFASHASRKTYLSRCEIFCQYPVQGTALQHAVGVVIGEVNDGNLFRDVVTIFTAEMRAYQIKRGEKPSINQEIIRSSPSFIRAYNACRYLNSLLYEYDEDYIEDGDGSIKRAISVSIDRMLNVHDDVYKELRRV